MHVNLLIFTSMSVKVFFLPVAAVVLSVSAHASATFSSSASASASCFETQDETSSRRVSPSTVRFKRPRAQDEENAESKGARALGLSAMSSGVSTGEAYYQQAIALKKEKKYKLAFEDFKRADQHGHVKAQVFLSRLYLDVELVRAYDPDNEDRVRELTMYYMKRAAKGGYVAYQKELWESIMPDNTDLEGEIKWAKRNAESGDEEALARLHEMTQDEEIEDDLRGYAQYKLGTLLHEGACVEKDLDKAFALLVCASKIGRKKAYDFIVENVQSAEKAASNGNLELFSIISCYYACVNERKCYMFARRGAMIAQKEKSPLYVTFMGIQYLSLRRIFAKNGCSKEMLERLSPTSFMALTSTPDYDTLVVDAKQKGLTRFST